MRQMVVLVLVIFIVALPISRYTSPSSRTLASCPNLLRAFTVSRRTIPQVLVT